MAETSEVQSVQRAARILVALADGDDDPSAVRDGRSVKALSTSTGLPVSTTHRLLRTLVECHLVEQDSLSEKYRLGPLTSVLGQSYRRYSNLERAEDIMKVLANTTGESVSLAALQGSTAIVISHVQSDQILRVDYSLGTHLAMHASAMGKVLLAFSAPDLVDDIANAGTLEAFTSHTICDPNELQKEIVKVRKSGYATNFGERFDGAHGVAVPVQSSDGSECRFALGVQGPASRITKKSAPELAQKCADSAQQMTELGLLY